MSKDFYVVKKGSNGNGAYFYYKNGLLHREAGPAIVTVSNMEELTSLGDEYLYQEEILSTQFPEGYIVERQNEIQNINGNLTLVFAIAMFYLEGKPYTQQDFEEIKSKLDLKNELITELPSKKINNKQIKV